MGNLILLEKSPNAVASNAAYSKKAAVYPSSKFLLTRCQCSLLQIGQSDQITKTMARLNPAPTWNASAIEERQNWYAETALDVWQLRHAAVPNDEAELVSSGIEDPE